MNYGELKNIIQGNVADSYSHRTDLAALVPDFIEQARIRIGASLRNDSNLVRETLTVASGSAAIPAGLQKVRSVLNPDDRPLLELDARWYGSLIATDGGLARGWYIADKIYTAPAQDGAFTIEYYRDHPAFTADGDDVPEPGLYIMATMHELAIFTDDAERMTTYESLFGNRMQELNRAHRFRKRARGRAAGYHLDNRVTGI